MSSKENITINNYSEKAIVVRGCEQIHTHDLTNLGGKWNERLKNGPGWIFPKTKLKSVEKWISTEENYGYISILKRPEIISTGIPILKRPEVIPTDIQILKQPEVIPTDIPILKQPEVIPIDMSLLLFEIRKLTSKVDNLEKKLFYSLTNKKVIEQDFGSNDDEDYDNESKPIRRLLR